MYSKAQRTCMYGVLLVAAELASRGLIVSTTSRNAMGADLLMTDDSCSRACSVQIKTNAKLAPFWLVGEKAKRFKSPTHVGVLVNLRNEGKRKGEHEYYVVPSEEVAQLMQEEHSEARGSDRSRHERGGRRRSRYAARADRRVPPRQWRRVALEVACG